MRAVNSPPPRRATVSDRRMACCKRRAIAHGAVVTVVNRLETIQVDEQQGQSGAAALGKGQLLPNPVQEQGALAGSDVAQGAIIISARQARDSQLRWQNDTIGALQLSLDATFARSLELGEQVQIRLNRSGGDSAHDNQGAEVSTVVAGQVSRLVVGIEKAALGVGDQNPIGGMVQDLLHRGRACISWTFLATA